MKLVFNVGVNDRKYPAKINGKNTKQYNLWKGVIRRCYDEKFHARQPTYLSCSVSDNFKSYSYFTEWCQFQVGFGLDGFQIDKDIVHRNNKVYSENTCVFVPREINTFFCDSRAVRGELPVGVCFHKTHCKYEAYCNVNAKPKYLGLFTTPEEAYDVYKAFKENLCKELATKWRGQIDNRVYDAMMTWSVE